MQVDDHVIDDGRGFPDRTQLALLVRGVGPAAFRVLIPGRQPHAEEVEPHAALPRHVHAFVGFLAHFVAQRFADGPEPL